MIDTTTNLTGSFQIEISNIEYNDTNGNSYTWNDGKVYSVVWNVVKSAHIYANLDTDTPDEAIIPADPNTEFEVARFKFKATNDDAELQELTLVNVTTGFKQSVYTGGSRNIDADNVISSVNVYDINGNKLGSASLVSGIAYFAFDNPVELPRDKDVVLIIKIKPNSIDDTGTDNKYVRFTVLKPGYNIDTKKTKIVSKGNGNEITEEKYLTFDSVVANAQYIRASVIHLADVAQSTPDLAAGQNDIYAFKVAADQAGAVKVKEFRFDVSVTDSTSDDSTGFYISNFEFWAGNNTNLTKNKDVIVKYASGECKNITGGDLLDASSVELTGIQIDSSGKVIKTTRAYCVVVILTGTYKNGYEITSEETFKLRAYANGVATNDSVTVRLNEVANNPAVMDTYSKIAAGKASIIWSDEAADNVTINTDNWFNDKDVEKLPLNSWTLSK